MVDFWFNHFNVFAGKGLTRNYLTEYERDAIRPHVLGKFRDLLGATAQSPAMLFYLDNWQSAAPEGADATRAQREAIGDRCRRRSSARLARPRHGSADAARGSARSPTCRRRAERRPRGLNENYARELMELHTLGVDGGYTQKDVQEVARAFTGWTIANSAAGRRLRFEPRMHDDGEKTCWATRSRRAAGSTTAEQVLDILAAHPSTAHFIATKLVRRFVADEPPAGAGRSRGSAIPRDERRHSRSRSNDRHLAGVLCAGGVSREGARRRSSSSSAAVRATAADSANAMPLVQALRELGMPPYQCQPPTGYADRAEAWVNTGALLNRMNFAVCA